MIPPNPGE
jgi:hypothetical protein